MPLFLTESDVTNLLTMPEAMDAVEAAFHAQGEGDGAANRPRDRFFLPKGVLHHMAAALPGKGVMGTKTYTSFADGTRFYVMLFSTETGELLAMIEADRLGQIRTGAATGVAARHLARPDAKRASLFGTGWQAQSQAEAVMVARPHILEWQVYSRDSVRREEFCRKMTARLNVRFSPMESPEATARGTEIITTATTAREPILKGEWLSPGDFVAAVGSNRLTAREIDVATVARAGLVVVDDIAQAKAESGELVAAYEARKWNWASAHTLADVVGPRFVKPESGEGITLFKSLGVALEDIAVAAVVYEKARAQGMGQTMS